MKKSTVKTTKPAVPAKKTLAKPVTKEAAPAVKRTVAVTKKVAAPKAPAVKAPAVKAPATKTPAVKAPAIKASPSQLPVTEIVALIDVGFGNTLYLRGEGPGLSWDVGVPLDCAADSQWRIALPGTGSAVVYKFLINDINWSGGPDYVTESGAKATVEPTF